MTTITIDPEFGYVIFTLMLSWVMLMYLGVRVGKARKKYDIKYPDMYSDKHPVFNCVQRGHQNALESYSSYVVFQIFAGIQYPMYAAIVGLAWIVSRISYAHGYYTGDPKKRLTGAIGSNLFLISLIGMSIVFACTLLNWC